MPNALALIRSLIIYGLCLPLAILLGYLLALPMDFQSLAILVIAVSLPLIPILLRWHHFLLIASWNISAVLFFLPIRPDLWIAMSFVSLLLSVLQHILNRESKFQSMPSVARPLIFLFFVIVATGALSGGIGLRSFGGEVYGGRRYVYLLAAIFGYFAISCNRVPRGREGLYVSVFFLTAMTALIGSLGGYLSPKFHFIFWIFPVESLESIRGEIAEDMTVRLMGLGPASAAVIWYGLARYGLRDLFRLSLQWHLLPFRFRGGFDVHQPWRALFIILALGASMQAGFRSVLMFFGVMFFCYFLIERLYWGFALPIILPIVILAGMVALPMVSKLPPNIQRTISFLPLDIDPVIRMGAEASTDWRLRIWQSVLPTVPRYLLVGKGYAINPAELAMTESRMGSDNTETAIVAGDYHNGPLTLIIPLGIWGAIGFLWFLAAGFRVLYRNYRHGLPELRRINTFLLLFFVVHTFFYFFVFGSFYSELFKFTGLVALSISINGTAPETLPVPEPNPQPRPLRLLRAVP